MSRRSTATAASVATVTWMGYDAPQINEVTDWPRSVGMPGLAMRGGEDLAGFLKGINASRLQDPHLIALGHSYGSLTTGYALQHGGHGSRRRGAVRVTRRGHLEPVGPARA